MKLSMTRQEIITLNTDDCFIELIEVIVWAGLTILY